MDNVKYAIRIIHGDMHISLFAICKNDNGQVGRHVELAREEFRKEIGIADSSSWVSVMKWN